MTPWTVARQAPLSLGILQARILAWVALPLLQGIFPTHGSNPGQADSLPAELLNQLKWTVIQKLSVGSFIFHGKIVLKELVIWQKYLQQKACSKHVNGKKQLIIRILLLGMCASLTLNENSVLIHQVPSLLTHVLES